MIKKIKRRLIQRKARMEFEKRGSQILWKMENDTWPNVIILKDGKWFIANYIKNSEFYFGHYWIEFSLEDSWKSAQHWLVKPENYIGSFKNRRLVVKSDDILLICEYDS